MRLPMMQVHVSSLHRCTTSQPNTVSEYVWQKDGRMITGWHSR